MPYKGGEWGEGAKKRSKRRLVYFREYSKNHPKVNKPQLGCNIGKGIVLAFLEGQELKCSMCGKDSRLLIHHKDGDMKNNAFGNLIIICRGCHNKVHIRNGKAKNKEREVK